MKSFVTGGNGFLGSHLIDRLLERGDEVHALVRKNSNLRWLTGKKVQLHFGDIESDLSGVEEGLKDADLVFHLAGVIRARKEKTYYKVNAQGTEKLLQSCLKVNPQVKRIVIVTSLAAHGPGRGDRPAMETDDCTPLSGYGASKREAEKIALRYMEQLPITIIRPPAIYGPRDDQVLQFFRMVKKGFLFIPGGKRGGEARLTLAHVQDVVTGLLLAASSPKALGEIFFVGEGHSYTWEQVGDTIRRALLGTPLWRVSVPKFVLYGLGIFAEIVTQVTGRLLPLNFSYARNFVQKNWTLDISKAKRVLDFQPSYFLTRGIQETVNWYQKEGWL
ncbi:MAG: NAD-dependent epimerase/dehydratase family protein [Deltaproteobacteria bacterium]|nr:NAD-dependent epimerase/dehydratase family protein [Deltaproteobacteria bacterium]